MGNLGSVYNVTSVFRRHADLFAQREAIVDVTTTRRYSWRRFDKRIDAAAAALRNAGIGRGDIVAILLYNCPEFLEAAFGANRLGAVFLPLNWRLASEELHYILENSGARALISEPAFYDVITGIIPRSPDLSALLALDPAVPPAPWQSYAALVDAQESAGARVEDAEVEEHDLHRLMYTSGTTAHPKGVMLSYANLFWKDFGHIVEFGITSTDRTLIVGPMYHVGALDLPSTGVLHAGGSLVILPKFDASSVLAAIEVERPTNMWLAPAMVNLLLQDTSVPRRDLSSVRFIIDGGEKMPIPLIQKVLAAFPNARFADAYGLTETVSGDTFLDKGNTLEKIGSVGKPVINLQMRIVDDNGRTLGPDEPGEVVLRGPKVFSGYWRNPDATAAVIDSDGWFHTGDIGRIDAGGYLYIVDRKKDIVISGGENIASLEVERVVYEHPAVLECAVVGRPDAKWGEVPVAFVARKPGSTATAKQIIESCSGKLAKFKIPKDVLFIDALPRNPSGKVLKRALRERFVPSTRPALTGEASDGGK